MSDCEIKWCKSGLPATNTTTEIIGDGAFSVFICDHCRSLFGCHELPEPDQVQNTLKKNPYVSP